MALMVPWRTFNIHGAFQMHTRFFKEEKGCLDFLNVFILRKKGYFKNRSLKGSLRNQKCIAAKKTPKRIIAEADLWNSK